MIRTGKGRFQGIFALLLILSMALGTGGCQMIPGLNNGPDTKAFRMYIDADHEFLIKIPPNWKMERKASDARGFLPATRWWKPDKGPQEVFVSILPPSMTPEQWLRLNWPELHLEPEGGDSDASPSRWTGKTDGRQVVVRSLPTPQRHYLAVASTTTERLEEDRSLLDAVLGSLAPLKTGSQH